MLASGGGGHSGFYLDGCSNNLIQGCSISGRSFGILTEGVACHANTIQGNTLSGNATAVYGNSSGQDNRILNNDLSTSSSWAISFSFDSGLEIAGNTYTGSANGIALASMNGLSLSGADLRDIGGVGLSLAAVSASTITGVVARAGVKGIDLVNCNGNLFSGVDASGESVAPAGSGFVLGNSAGNTIENSTVSLRATGIHIAGQGNTVGCSVITANATGILVASGSAGNVVRQNQIVGNTLFGVNSGESLDAENNYWGASDGPGPAGSGNAIAGPVDAVPFFSELPPLLSACGGIENAPPGASCSGGGTYQVGIDPIVLQGSVFDLEGDGLAYVWHEGPMVYFAGTIATVAGGTPVVLPVVPMAAGAVHSPSTGVIGPGSHTITLTVNDGRNADVECVIQVEVVDTLAPTLAPSSDLTSLWPPNHQMVQVIIQANAFDNSGTGITLSATVTSNEPADAPGNGDGNTSPDCFAPVIDQQNGTITVQVRAERAAKGPGRVYCVAITATDLAGNATTSVALLGVPHDMR